MRLSSFHHLAIQVRDLEKTEAFYVAVLGLAVKARHAHSDGTARSVWLELPGGGFLALERVEGEVPVKPFRDDRPGLHLLALRIPRADRAAVVRELHARGIAVEHETRWTVYVRDPEGNRIGLSHHPEDP